MYMVVYIIDNIFCGLVGLWTDGLDPYKILFIPFDLHGEEFCQVNLVNTNFMNSLTGSILHSPYYYC